jgi:tetratricopeptide (TPR) repeat protein
VNGQNDKALADREQVVKLTPNAAEAYVARAETYYMLGRYAEGLADQTKAIELQPDYEIAWAARGASYFALQRAPEAIGDLDKALKLKPDDAQAARLLAQAHAIEALSRQPVSVTVGRPNGPIQLPPPWMQPFPELPLHIPPPQILVPLAAAPGDTASAVLHNQRGRELSKVGRYHSAIEELTAAIAADRTYAPAYNARGFAYYMLRDYTRAIADFDKAIELMPSYKNAIDNRAAARRAAGFKIER